MIGYKPAANGRPVQITNDHADCALLLLADATGHGIGPALSAMQLRAMLRMAVRSPPQLDQLIRQLNEQLFADLPAERFITAWFGELSAADHTLTSFSAGQGPLLHFLAASVETRVVAADSYPLGINAHIGGGDPTCIPMSRGDVLAAISGGIFESIDATGKQFGIERAIEIITGHRRSGASKLLLALRQAVSEFTQDSPAADDRTIIVINRV